jgi:hypothetical protein
MNWLNILLGILCVWRVTHLLSAEDGPWRILSRFREAAGSGFWGQLLGCFYCLSLYTAATFAFAIASSWRDRLMLCLALSAGAILLERLTGEQRLRLQDLYTEDPADELTGREREDTYVLR